MITFIMMSALSEPMWFRHRVDNGLSTQPSPENIKKLSIKQSINQFNSPAINQSLSTGPIVPLTNPSFHVNNAQNSIWWWSSNQSFNQAVNQSI